MKYRLELVNADTRCACQGATHKTCSPDPSSGVETVVAVGTLAELSELIKQMEAIPLGDHNTTYIRAFDPDGGGYLPMHFGPSSNTAEGGVYCS